MLIYYTLNEDSSFSLIDRSNPKDLRPWLQRDKKEFDSESGLCRRGFFYC